MISKIIFSHTTTIALVLALFISCNNNQQLPQTQTIIGSLKQQYAPDKRTKVWNIQPSMQKNIIVLKGETDQISTLKKLTQQLKKQNIQYINQVLTLPAPNLKGQTVGLINLSVANIRSEPKHSAELSTQALLGTPINILKKQDDWYYIQTPDQYLGWIDQEGIVPMNQKQQNSWLNKEKIIITKEFEFAYDTILPHAQPISDLVHGNILSIQHQSNSDYYNVNFPDGRTGYVIKHSAQTLDHWLDHTHISPSTIIQSAKKRLGYPYLWGGTSPKGMDCSGFIKTVYLDHGIILPRDASQQVHIGPQITIDSTLSKLKNGDLLFFGRKLPKTQKEKIWHVAIYIGNGQMIHSSGSVKIESLVPNTPNFAAERRATLIRVTRPLDPSYIPELQKLKHKNNT